MLECWTCWETLCHISIKGTCWMIEVSLLKQGMMSNRNLIKCNLTKITFSGDPGWTHHWVGGPQRQIQRGGWTP